VKIAILSNDLIPGMGLPVAAPGIRTWGLALGLRELGHDVTLILEQWMISQVWQSTVPPPLPPGCVIIAPKRIREYVQAHEIQALVITNSNHATSLGDLGDCRLVYDFFAPKMLELAENVARTDLAQAKAHLERQKLAALARSDAVVVNGAKKLDYVREWMTRSGVPDLPVAVVNPGVPPVPPESSRTGPLQVIVSGYLQPWSRPGAWAEAIIPLLDEGTIDLHLLVGFHWGQRQARAEMTPEMKRLAEHPAVRRHSLLRFGDFRSLLARCHLSLDVFARNPERELAMVTRSVVALSCGLPVMHVPFSEVSGWIEEYDAGWLVDEDDVAAMRSVLADAASDLATLEPKRAGAIAVSREVLEPAVAAAPLEQILREIT
jgi:glycosyltransferase involved in cell wall biosynthesis